ncbi:hypothetical protein [Croceicoccus hydrothermalis]|uniref:hypothetical protein n=1 Tax=Croceicoccus hydrothermalis TaxID=2867964 RepID=UPI001EFB8FC7|nr:hypothetical protein [Croceicoccus hydrothermalis]
MTDLVLSILVFAAAVFVFGAFVAWRRGDRKRAGLMTILAFALMVNVAIWTVPTDNGAALVDTPAD